MTDSQIDREIDRQSDEWDKRTNQLRMYRLGFAATSVLFTAFLALLSWKGLLP